MTISELIEKSRYETFEPETVRVWFPDLTEEEFNEIQAAITVRSSNYPFENFYAFENVVRALNGIVPNVEMIEGAEPKWIWYACEIIEKLRPNMEPSQEVVEYVKKIYADEGIYFLHPYITKNSDDPQMSDYAQIYAAAEYNAENGPNKLEPNSFINRQTIELLKMELYVANKRGDK